MIVLMMFGCLYTYLGKGPLWPENLPTASNCKDNWWTNLLYVNNFVYVDDPVKEKIFVFLFFKCIFVAVVLLSSCLRTAAGLKLLYSRPKHREIWGKLIEVHVIVC